ncbi:amino acid adenylation domain-containing protein [Rhizobium sp. CNPSo 3464]|uniref:non-ribosomal peptide synthetase/type I polyketide synthase n=1 Tax=Rhizobium sp. CNPSo 3464 TaxID=3021406 RepID=UPI00254ACB98|nr:non-ribosomal peptide synthetase/type I polyketide synthase [Rhizobium sp. CNPSo 3464]MDK4740181.1 amino acid adenylation domain-containing protein [Rhizobium sp. CNPSo 3464]
MTRDYETGHANGDESDFDSNQDWDNQDSGGIAIIGMSGRFPGAPSVEALWQLICEGRNAFSQFSPEELEDAFTDEERAQPNFVPARPHLRDVELFDADFFGMYPREAALTDPQHRVFLEICWEALEDGGYDPQRYPGMIGVFAGSSMPTYLINNVLGDRAKAEEFTSNYQIGCFQHLVGALNDTLATRIAYKFNLRGPAFTLQSACSTSLLAVSQACQNLLTYSCDMALAGGVSITIPQRRGYIYQEGGMASPDGTCRPFDANAAGTVFASGAGVVLLKRQEDALRDGDHIYAVIRGYGVNNDGSDKVGFVAPSVEGQAEAISAAFANAAVSPATIGYVECHGTATPLGDPIEFSGLKGAFSEDPPAPASCALGSVKGNIGHTDAAAGVTGLIKTALALGKAKIPPMPNYEKPNPRIDLDHSPFYIPTEMIDWPEMEGPRRAGVSAFGVGGTNIHVIVEEPPVRHDESVDEQEGPYLLPLSASNPAALSAMRTNLADHLAKNPGLPLAQVAHTLQAGRREFNHRLAIAASTTEEAIDRLTAERYQPLIASDQPPVAFMFPGQGAQYAGMGAGLYSAEPEFARWIDRGAELLKMTLGVDLRDYICHTGPVTQAMADEQRETRIAQPCLYLVEYALARLWLSRGVKPYAMIGHSVGEFVAATLANVISFEDGLRLVANRGRLMQNQPQGAMVSVRADAETVAMHLRGKVEIAAINAPKLSVISGPFEDIDTVCTVLESAGIAFSRLHTSHAFHSAMMDEAVIALREETAKTTYGTATMPYISCVTGDWQTGERGTSPDYWATHCRDAVHFADGLMTLCRGRKPVLLEVGPGRTLSVFAAQTIARDGVAAIVQSLPEHDRAFAASETLAEAHGKLWMAGYPLEWPALPASAQQRLGLPTYPFQRQRHWIDAPQSSRRAASQPALPAQVPVPAASFAADVNLVDENKAMNVVTPLSLSDRVLTLETSLLTLLSEMSGETLGVTERAVTFLELGFDSLFVGQFAQRIEKEYKVKLSFRELLSNIPSVADLALHLDQQMPPDAVKPVAAPVVAPVVAPAAPVAAASSPIAIPTALPVAPMPMVSAASPDLAAVLQSQIQLAQSLFAQQLAILQGGTALVPAAAAAIPAVAPPVSVPVITPAAAPAAPAAVKPASDTAETEFGTERIKLYRPGAKSLAPEITNAKRAFIADLTAAYEAKNAKSKAFTKANRHWLADPRTASGFRADWKEMVFPIVCDHSKGAHIWDVDGNKYVDLVNGFGQTAFGHAPDFVIDAIKAQADIGFAIGPQTPLAGEVAGMIAEVTGHERVTFCNTGSEAVMAAMRLARAVTGRDRIVVFANDYHGQFDEVLVKGRNRADRPIALPIASGIPMGSVSNMTVLRYGAPESLDFIRANAEEIAAVIIEPIQSRHPELQPIEFVRELRDVATKSEFALVFDEVVTGFRVDPGGMQAIWGIKGDMATYGKVVGGGMPIGVLVGSARFMDALDGGHWNYGDDSVPMTAPTFFAGTFVRHPLVLAAAHAVLHHIKGEGAELYGRVAERTQALVAEMKAELARRGIADVVHGYKSWFAADFSSQDSLGSLFYAQMRLNGVHIQEGYPCFLTTAHSEDDFQTIAKAFRDTLDALQSVGILAPAEDRPASSVETKVPVVARAPRPQSAPLTEAQTEIWLAAQAGDEASCSFNESFSLKLEGAFDEKAFRKAIDTVVDRHDAFHIRFDRSGQFFHFIPDFKLDLPLVDGANEAHLRQIIEDEALTPFDLVNGPLVRASIVKLGHDKHVFVFTGHHIVCDGWSINVFVDELSTAYAAYQQGEMPHFEPALSFAAYSTDFAPKPEKSGATEQFWLDQFKTVPDLPEMPLDRPRPEYRSFAGGTCTGFIGEEVYKTLKKAGAKSGATLFSTLLATLQVTISRLSGQEDIVIAIPSAGQSLVGDQILVGHCVNLLPLRQTVTSTESFVTHLKATQQLVFQAFEHQDYTYGTLVRKLGIKRDSRRLPLTEIQFNLERMAGGGAFGNLKPTIEPNAKAFSNFDMFFNMIEAADHIRIDVDYNADVFDRATIERWIGHFSTLAAALAKDMERKVSELSLLTADEKSWLIESLNHTAMDYNHDEFAFSLFARKAAEHPHAVAAEHDGHTITYGELETRSNQLALYLQMAIPEPGQRIALLVERSLEMIVALLAVMKAGHTYVPMDPAHPEPRLRQTLDIARVGGLICDSDEMARLAASGTPIIRTDKDAKAIGSMTGATLKSLPTDTTAPAYIIFTSGSTGMPKGVEVSHRALTNFLLSMAKEPGFTANDTLIAVTTISFDIAGLEIYLPLISGGKVVVANRMQVQDGFALVRLINEHNATVLQATPTLWQMLTEAGLKERPNLKMLCGGEPLPKELAKSLLTIGGELWNMYGPTETTIWSSLQRITDADQPITIGHPIANTQLYILDQNNSIAPIGVTGELHIGGDGLANGYFDRLDLTEKAFVPFCFATGRPKRLYKTGDVGRRLADGSLQLLGRRDQQIKLRGFRIELGDIEAVVSKAEGVRQCAVVAAENQKGDRSLVCYVVPTISGIELSPANLAAHAKANLPGHMVPSFWVTESELPQTANGKLDRKTLQLRGVPQREAAVVKVQPKTETERRILTIWEEVLNLGDISVDDNLYALGADSLTIFRIAARMLDTGLPLEAKHLLRHPSVAELAAFADSQGEIKADPAQFHVPSLKDFRNGARRGLERAI